MEKPVQVERYGQTVWELPEMDKVRRDNCMCLHCGKLKKGDPNNCKIAEYFFKMCQQHGNAMIMTRCDSWCNPI